MTLQVGQKLSRYHIVEKLGEGGMGVVWKAVDTRLDREVALKVPPADMASDPVRMSRFEREAKAIAALNHPNIAAIHEIDEADGIAFIVMELVSGLTLARTIGSRPLPIDSVLDLSIQISDGLDAAHMKGIIHRDIKPANIIVNERGQAKILDFGLAKLVPQLGGGDSSGASGIDTVTASPKDLTHPGSAMGTVAYMSPEQVRGEELDLRSDLFSLGAVIYEMATGSSPFTANTFGLTYDAILNRTPASPCGLNGAVPPRLEEIIYKSLEKDRRMRYQGAADLRTDLARLRRDSDSGRNLAIGAGAARTSARWRARRSAAPMAAVVLLVLALLAWLGYRAMAPAPAAPLGPIDSVAVLPFVNASDNPDAQYLGDGITESLINRLSKLPNLRVVPRSLVLRYKDRQANPAELGAELGARAVVTGRVAQRGDTLIIGAELVDVATVSQLWGQQYSRTLTDIFSVQEEIAREISRNLRLRLTPEDQESIGRSYTRNTEAFQLYSKSLHHMRRGTREDYEEAIRLAQQALVADLRQRGAVEEGESEDPGFALAYSALARIYTLQAFNGFVPPREVYPKAQQAALFALQMDDSLADAHGSLAFVRFFYEWDWDAAENEFRRALELEPGDDEIRRDYSGYLLAMGRSEEAVAEARRARELDPVSDEHSALLAQEYFWTRRYDEALAEMSATLGLNPDSGVARLRPQIRSVLGEHDAAIAGYREYLAGGGHEDLFNPTMAYFLGAAGRREEALAAVSDEVSAVQRAWIHAALGERDRAFDLLETAYEERAINLLWIKVQPWFDPLRSDARFDDLLRRMNLPR